MYLIRKMTNLSFPDIGKEFSRDHTTAMHSIRKVESIISNPDHPLNRTLQEIMSNINSKL